MAYRVVCSHSHTLHLYSFVPAIGPVIVFYLADKVFLYQSRIKE